MLVPNQGCWFTGLQLLVKNKQTSNWNSQNLVSVCRFPNSFLESLQCWLSIPTLPFYLPPTLFTPPCSIFPHSPPFIPPFPPFPILGYLRLSCLLWHANLNTQVRRRSQGPHTRERAMFIFPGQGYLAQNDYVQLHSFLCKLQFSIQLYDIPLCSCDTFLPSAPLIGWWASRLFPMTVYCGWLWMSKHLCSRIESPLGVRWEGP